MPCSRAVVAPGAYLSSPAGLSRVHALRPSTAGVMDVLLTDESEPLDTQRTEDGRWFVLEPELRPVPLHRVLREFDLALYVPSSEDVASAEEFGRYAIAPE